MPDEADLNMVVAGLLSDLAIVHTSEQRKWGYKRAASAIRGLDVPLPSLVAPDGTLPRIHGIGPASTRVITEVLATGTSPTVERAVAGSSRAADVHTRRTLRQHFLSRARVREVLASGDAATPGVAQYQGDLHMHSTWSDGSQSLEDIAGAALARGHTYAAITDHSAGLPVARGVSIERFVEQHREIDAINASLEGRLRLLKGVEANILADGTVDVDPTDRRLFDIVVAAPHSVLRSPLPQTARLVRAATAPGVHILGHPRGRMYGSRAGVVADWPEVFAAAAAAGVAVELDGDPSRQDLDHVLARQALEAGCLFALDSDAHGVGQSVYADTAIAHARLTGIPRERVVNCWPLPRLLDWARTRSAQALAGVG